MGVLMHRDLLFPACLLPQSPDGDRQTSRRGQLANSLPHLKNDGVFRNDKMHLNILFIPDAAP